MMRKILLIGLLGLFFLISSLPLSVAQEEPIPDSFDILVSNPAPAIFEEITFTADIQTERDIDQIVWNFGDGSDSVFGEVATHIYTEGSGNFDYRVLMIVIFDESDGSEDLVVSISLQVSDLPPPGTCPPDSVATQVFARSVLLESAGTGCTSFEVPSHLIDQSALISNATTELITSYTWEALPTSEDVGTSAIMTVNYERNGSIIDNDKFNLLEREEGFFTVNPHLTVPENTEIKIIVSLVIVSNPSMERVALEVGPIEIRSSTNCQGAQFFARNIDTESQGNGISFASNISIELVLENNGCGEISVIPASIAILNGEVEVARIPNGNSTISENESLTWEWNQRNATTGEQVPTGVYLALIQTDRGQYTTQFSILENSPDFFEIGTGTVAPIATQVVEFGASWQSERIVSAIHFSFGDGSEETVTSFFRMGARVKHAYAQPSADAPYVVKATFQFEDGMEPQFETAVTSIVINDPPDDFEFDFTFSPENPVRLEDVTFTPIFGESSFPQVIWDFGDGSPVVEGLSVTHEYSAVSDPDQPFLVKMTSYTMLDLTTFQEVTYEVEKLVTVNEGNLFEIGLSNVAPRIFEGVAFFAQIRTERPIDLIEWDFGDGSDPAFGYEVSHEYEDSSPENYPYRVKMTVYFADSQSPPSLFVTMPLPVGDTPIPGTCPPDSVTTEVFAQSVVLHSGTTGCASIVIPKHLFSTIGDMHNGPGTLDFEIEWEALDPATDLIAILTLQTLDSNGNIVDVEHFNLTRDMMGRFSIGETVTVSPEAYSIQFVASIVIPNNPNSALTSLVIKPITLTFPED